MSYEKNKPQTNWVTYTIDGVAYELAPELLDGVEQCLLKTDALKIATEQKNWKSNKTIRQLKEIKNIRLQKLMETDFWVLRGDITDAQKLYRKNLRDIPTNYDSSKYDELLARETDKTKDNFGQLTHAVWEKP